MTKQNGGHYKAKLYLAIQNPMQVIQASYEARALKGLIVFMTKMLVGSR